MAMQTSSAAHSQETGSWGVEAGPWAVLVHGGAGDAPAIGPDPGIAACRRAASAAAELLRTGGSALDAVERAVLELEADPRFNAGIGATLTEEGLIELDAAIMEGRHLAAGAVCALPPFLHPISIARAALEDGRHVLYAAEGAARFAVEHGFVPSTTEEMRTPEALERWRASRSPHARLAAQGDTVGAVARDVTGNLAAATSTGGLLNKRSGRVGDSPLLGAGTYADNEAGACSATGLGEFIMRLVLAKTATDCLAQGFLPVAAARHAVALLGGRVGGRGGIILIDRSGRLGWARNTPAMTWAACGAQMSDASGS